MVQKISSGQIFPEDLNPHCDSELEEKNQKISHNTLAHYDAPLNQVWLQKVQNFSLSLEDLCPHCDLDLEDRNPTFSQDTKGHQMIHQPIKFH